ncbi:outer membrane protein assembly factor BamA [Novacetimonas hansenii]|uniref:outer membrane protein assembly factor BamA n=1 Tax=Novacetimonas hansenii TaxID=436 RepID=UPI002156E62D|nr:outer membrane protein assembly factor BamA [Novacetimonas hansenii]GBQ57032.1 outer membrane protein [Novacetimonas hansenii NRIC 0243]
MPILSSKRSALLASVCVVPLFWTAGAHAQDAGQEGGAPSDAPPPGGMAPTPGMTPEQPQVEAIKPPPLADPIEAVDIKGNDRIETNTILSYMVVQPGDRFDQDLLDRSLKTLYATGLFKDVTMQRSGNMLVVHVVENPIVNRIIFEGNHSAKDEDLTKVISLRPRAVFSTKTIAADRQKILGVYAEKARYAATVTPQVIRLAHNRVDVIFRINEAQKTLIRKVTFVGNRTFSSTRLAGVVSSKETAWYRFFSSSDQYNPERIKYDAELLHRFYLKNGFVDFQIKNATGELSPDHKAFYITYTMEEGPRYRLNKMDIRSSLRHVSAESLHKYISLFHNQWYDGSAIQHNATSMQEILQAKGYPFAMVHPEIARNPEKRTVNLLFDVSEGPRMYVERIDINGNTITQDKVIRRQLPMSEGDPYTPMDRKYSKAVLEDLGFFKTVSIDQTPGSSPDKVNISADVVEKPTGEFSLGGGYSSDAGVLGNLGLKQHNLLGTGIDAGFSGTAAYYEDQADISVTDPYFLNRNLVAGIDIFGIQNRYMTYQNYSEGRYGMTLRMGYSYNNHLSQSWSYTLTDRNVGDTWSDSSWYVLDQSGWSLLSQLSTTLTYDTRDRRSQPHSGYVIRVGGDFAGIGGNERYVRGKIDAAYYIPLDSLMGNHDWTVGLRAGAGDIANWGGGRSDIIDNFYLGGNTLRGFLDGGAGPRSMGISARTIDGVKYPMHSQEDFLGGRFMYTASATIHFPMPFAADMGIKGRYFVDAGGLDGLRVRERYTSPSDGYKYTPVYGDTLTPRVSTGVGFSWKSPFGLINIDLGVPIIKQKHDRTQLLRFGFGQQF